MSDSTEVDKKNPETCKTRDEHGKWLPGVSPNPAGRPPKGDALTDIMREYLDGCVDSKDGITRRKRGEIFVQAVYAAALKGNTACMKLLWEQIDGSARQKIDATISGDDRDRLLELIQGIRKDDDETAGNT